MIREGLIPRGWFKYSKTSTRRTLGNPCYKIPYVNVTQIVACSADHILGFTFMNRYLTEQFASNCCHCVNSTS